MVNMYVQVLSSLNSDLSSGVNYTLRQFSVYKLLVRERSVSPSTRASDNVNKFIICLTPPSA